MKQEAMTLKVIAWLIAIVVGLLAYLGNRAINEIDELKQNQMRAQENHVVIMERIGVQQSDIQEAQSRIEEIREQLQHK